LREVRDCVNNLFGCALRSYRSAPVNVDFTLHIRYLSLILGLFKHYETRRHLALHCSYPFCTFLVLSFWNWAYCFVGLNWASRPSYQANCLFFFSKMNFSNAI